MSVTGKRGIASAVRGALAGLSILLTAGSVFADENCAIPAPPEPGPPEIAVSLRDYEADLSQCQAAGSCSLQTLTFYGMTRVTGFLLDSVNHNILLFGTKAPAAAPLRGEDFAVALRNALGKYAVRQGNGNVLLYSNPGVSIDPDPAVLHKLHQIMAMQGGVPAARDRHLEAWCTTCELPQIVRSMGVPHDTHFLSVMFTADYLLKRVSNGTAPITGLDSLSELTMRRAIEGATQHPPRNVAVGGLNRFWFYPGQTAYLEAGGTVVLARADVILRNEAEQLTRDGRVSPRADVDPLAQSFACAFSKAYPDLASARSRYPIFAELENLFRWVALVKILVDGNAFEEADYVPNFLLEGFVMPRVPVPHSVEGVASVRKWDHSETDENGRTELFLALPSCGGVSLEFNKENMHALPDKNGQLPGTNTAVLVSRPARRVAWWDVRM